MGEEIIKTFIPVTDKRQTGNQRFADMSAAMAKQDLKGLVDPTVYRHKHPLPDPYLPPSNPTTIQPRIAHPQNPFSEKVAQNRKFRHMFLNKA